MTITQFGRVEPDLEWIPAPAAPPVAQPGFEKRLEQAAKATRPGGDRGPAEVPSGHPAGPSPAGGGTQGPDVRAAGAADGPQRPAGSGPALAAGRTQAAGMTEAEPQGTKVSSGQGVAAGRSTTEPQPPARPAPAPAPATQAPPPERAVSAGANGPAVPAAAVEPTAQAEARQAGETRGVAAPARVSRPAARTTPIARAASYKSLGKQALQLSEQARDSVFKQILWRVRPEGGEARFLLDPPELGRVDLRVVVENGALRLAIATERADLAAALQRHMGELGDALAARGLAVADAHVRARDGRSAEWGTRREAWRGARRATEDDPLDEDLPALAPMRRFVRAEGLDFWA